MRVYEASVSVPSFYPGMVKKKAPPLNFPHDLAALCKERGLTQLALAERVAMHISQIRPVIGSIILRNTMKEAPRRFAADSGAPR